MRIALPFTLLLSLASLGLALAAAFGLYASSVVKPPLQVIIPPADLQARVASAEDLSSLKRLCIPLAESIETHIAVTRANAELVSRTLSGGLQFFLAWGAIFGVGLLYVYVVLRRAQGAFGGH